MKLSKTEGRVLSVIYKSSDGLEAFTIYRRLKLTYGEFNKSILSLTKKGLIEETDKKFRITSIGKNLLLKHKNVYLITKDKIWRRIPVEFIQSKIEPNELYTPSKSLLDSRQFNKD